jgi:hypothetical protein
MKALFASTLSNSSTAGAAIAGRTGGIDTRLAPISWNWIVTVGCAAGVWTLFLANAKHFQADAQRTLHVVS